MVWDCVHMRTDGGEMWVGSRSDAHGAADVRARAWHEVGFM